MFEIHAGKGRVRVRGNGRETSFRMLPAAFELPWTDGPHARVPIVREMVLLGSLLQRLYPEAKVERRSVLERWPGPPRHLVREFVRLCSALAPVLDDARTRAGDRVVTTQETVLRTIGSIPTLLVQPALYDDPHLPEDLIRYRAAIAATRWLVPDGPPDEALAALRRWRSLYSPTGRSYKSLNLTLDAVHEHVNLRLLPGLRLFKLRRPILDPAHLNLLLRTVRLVAAQPDPRVRRLLPIVVRSSCDELRRAYGAVRDHYNLGNLEHICRLTERRLVQLLVEAEATPRTRIVRLLETAIERERTTERELTILELGGHERRTTEPPIPLPISPHLRFLATVGDILAESDQMHHCVHTYARGAVLGDYYLFHVEHQGQHATAQVDRDGLLGAVQGPRNQDNPAVQKATELLEPWAKDLADHLGFPEDPFDQLSLFDDFDEYDETEVELLRDYDI